MWRQLRIPARPGPSTPAFHAVDKEVLFKWIDRLSFNDLVILAVVAFLVLQACHAPFNVGVADIRGGVRQAYYTGEALDLQVRWDAVRDKNKAVGCQILDTFSGTAVWEGTATVPEVQAGSLETLTFDPPLPRDGQFGPEGRRLPLGLRSGRIYQGGNVLRHHSKVLTNHSRGGLRRPRSPLFGAHRAPLQF